MSRDIAPGDPCTCEGCEGWLFVYHTKVVEDVRIRSLKCRVCGALPGKQTIPLRYAPRTRRPGRPKPTKDPKVRRRIRGRRYHP